jgi:hypothetical protein
MSEDTMMEEITASMIRRHPDWEADHRNRVPRAAEQFIRIKRSDGQASGIVVTSYFME